ncbi:MAG TPA: chemotaxis protein CheR [Clostridiales bacterium]|nr:chemotaxis protein CheR [Clostridiales bacterium]
MEIENCEFNKLMYFIKSNYGINLEEKKVLLEGRLSNMILERGFESFEEYIRNVFMDNTGKEVKTLINKVTTNHTFFMREPVHFEFLRSTVLPYLENNIKDRDIRIWSAGCSSGEEAYTIAMIIDDYFGEKKYMWDTQILATDISENVLKKGTSGIFNEVSLINMPNSFKLKYFKKIDDENYEIKQKLKNEVIFREFNLMEEKYPFKRNFDIIFCRNVMIYFDQDTKIDLVSKFYNSTKQGGYLFIGHSEYINKEETKYKHIMPAVYRRVET